MPKTKVIRIKGHLEKQLRKDFSIQKGNGLRGLSSWWNAIVPK
jgi:hypothetical protein